MQVTCKASRAELIEQPQPIVSASSRDLFHSTFLGWQSFCAHPWRYIRVHADVRSSDKATLTHSQLVCRMLKLSLSIS